MQPRTITLAQSVKVTKTDKSGYTEFIKKHMKDKDLVNLPVTERMKKIGEMWRKSK